MKLYIVLPISQLKRLNKISALILIVIPFVFYGQSADSIKTERPVRIDYNFIDSYPQNAVIQINDMFIGNTPLFFEWKDSTFPKTIKITKHGFSEQTEIINNIQLLNKKFNLTSTGKHSIINTVVENKQTYFKEPRKVVPIVISSIITAGSGIAAFYFKSLASDNRKYYEEFQDESFLDKKNKYDILGGVSLVALQLGFGALLYFLFID